MFFANTCRIFFQLNTAHACKFQSVDLLIMHPRQFWGKQKASCPIWLEAGDRELELGYLVAAGSWELEAASRMKRSDEWGHNHGSRFVGDERDGPYASSPHIQGHHGLVGTWSRCCFVDGAGFICNIVINLYYWEFLLGINLWFLIS